MIFRFKNFIKESIIDIPRRTYAPGVFDDADTKNPKLKPSVVKQIEDQIKVFAKEYPVIKIGLIGSILTKRYRDDADLDINVLFDIPEDKDRPAERERLVMKFISSSNPKNVQGKLIPGTKHPINYFMIADPKIYDDQQEKADASFDIRKNKFIKRPADFVFNVNDYIKDFNRKVQELDVVKGELKRDIIDYDELKELGPNDIENLQSKIEKKLKEIEDSIKDIIKIGDDVDADRRAAFDKDMSPDEIRKYGIKNRLPKNVIYKMLEKYHYLKFYKKCKKILDDGKVTDAEIDSLKEAVGSPKKHIAFTFGRFNPPTIGHEKLINKVASVSANDYLIIPTKTTDAKKNPLKITDKLRIMKQMFPRHSSKIKQIPGARTAMEVLNNLNGKANQITMVVGSDRVREFDTLLNKYNGVKARGTNYKFDKINVVSAGERDPDAEGAMGMSASKMRDAASKNDLQSFKRGLPVSYRDKDGLFKLVRKGMNLENMSGAGLGTYAPSADINPTAKKKVIVERFTQWQIRDLYIREQLFNKNDIVNDTIQEVTGKVIRRSTNYIVLEDKESNLHKCWIWNCLPVSNVDEVKLHEHNLDVDYGFEAVSETEVKMNKQKTYEDIKKREESYEIGKDYANHTKEITPGETPSEKPVDSKTRAEQSAEKIDKEDIKNWAASSETIDKYKTRYGEDWEKELEEATNKMEERLKVQSFKQFNNSQGD